MEILSRKEAAKLLGVSVNSLDKWRKEGKIGFYQPRPGCKVTFKKEHIDAFLAQAEHRPRTGKRNSGN